MNKRYYWIGIVSVFLLALGLYLVQPLKAGPADSPGSNTDPLVSKSYVDKALQEKVNQLEQQVATLTQRAEAYRAALNNLEKTAGLPLTPAVAPVTVPTTTTTPTTPPTNSSTSTPTTSPNKIGTTTDPGTRVRTGPGTSYSIVAELPKGTQLTVLGEKDGWYNVRLQDGRQGWSLKSLIQLR